MIAVATGRRIKESQSLLELFDGQEVTMQAPRRATSMASLLLENEPTAAFNPGFSRPTRGSGGSATSKATASRPKDMLKNFDSALSNALSQADSVLSTTLKSNTFKGAFVGATFAAMLFAAPAFAGVPEAAKDFTDAVYPIVASLKKDTVAPLTGKAIQVALTANPKDIIKTIDAGLDAFLSTSPDKFIATVKALKLATAEAASASNCNLICMPGLETAEKVGAAAADALSTADPKKVGAFANQAIATLNSADKFALAPLLLDGGKFAASLDPGDVAKATGAALELGKASGAL